MRYLTILGVMLIAAGLFVILRPPSYSSEQSVLKLGDLEAKVQQQRTVPGWVGGTLLGAGCVLLVLGIRKR
jgi:drug/metabolite transporter (DMT)-like permease